MYCAMLTFTCSLYSVLWTAHIHMCIVQRILNCKHSHVHCTAYFELQTFTCALYSVLWTAHIHMCIVQSTLTLFTSKCALYTVSCSEHLNVQCIMNFLMKPFKWALKTCTVYKFKCANCTMYTVQCIVYCIQ